MTSFCTSANATNTSPPTTTTSTTEKGNDSSLPLTIVAPLALGVLLTSLKLVLWRARVVARWLDEDATRVWNDGSPMLDCSNKEGFHQHVIQTAIDRGIAALGKTSGGALSNNNNVTTRTNDATNYYHGNSSSGESLEDDAIRKLLSSSTSSSIENETNGDTTTPQKIMSKPRKMSKQVGGMDTHKRPVLTLDDFILKPLRLPMNHSRRKNNNSPEVDEERAGERRATHHHHHHHHHHPATTKNDYRDGINDETKAYRGVREVAFYEALEFASSLSRVDIDVASKVFQRFASKGVGDVDVNAIGTGHAVIFPLLSLYKEITPRTLITGAARPSIVQQPLCPSFIHSCRHPCIGYHNIIQYAKSGSMSSLSPQSIPCNSRMRMNDSLLSRLGYLNSMTLFVAYYAGDTTVLSSIQSYERSWRSLIKEVAALKRLSEFTSQYFGVVDLDNLKQDTDLPQGRLPAQHHHHLQSPHLLLKNLTAPFPHPNIIDIKMGTQTYEPTAPPSKRIREAKKYPPQSEIGFRIVGMRVMHNNNNNNNSPPSAGGGDDYTCWGKSFGFNLKTKEEVMRALMTFFHCDGRGRRSSSHYTQHILSCVIRQLTRIKKWFEAGNDTLAFYASSILIVHGGCQNPGDPIELGDGTPCVHAEPIVKMIDFAHVCRESGGDKGYLKGVTNLLSILEEIHNLEFQ